RPARTSRSSWSPPHWRCRPNCWQWSFQSAKGGPRVCKTLTLRSRTASPRSHSGGPCLLTEKGRPVPELSIVVPIYNVAPYLAACLESLAAQTFEDFEVVMVDDGSTDDSGEIAAGFAARDDRFRLVTKANGGLGAARNTGIDHASGNFLAFVDSDDLIPLY